MANRIDKARITGKIKKDADGVLKGTAVVARTGILEYFENGKIVRELVRPDELGKADSIDSLRMKPVTNNHPSVSLVNPQNVKQYQCGFTGENVQLIDGLLSTTVTINDAVAIKDVENGKRELSCGYTCDLKEEAGIWNGERYDREQLNRKYNHVAICDLGRAGAVASLHLDSSDVFEVGTADFKVDSDINNPQRSSLMKLTINGVTAEFTEQQVADHVAKQDATIADLNKTHKDAIDKLSAERDTFKDKHEKLEAKVKTDAAALPLQIIAAAKARTDLERVATPHLDKADVDKIGELADIDIKKAVIVKAFPKVDLKDASEVYIQARYESALDVLADHTIETAAAQNRKDAMGTAGKETESKKQRTTEDCEKEVTEKWKKGSNRDAIMGK